MRRHTDEIARGSLGTCLCLCAPVPLCLCLYLRGRGLSHGVDACAVPGYASAYTLSGCSSPADCGVYSLVSAHCTTSSSHCPGGGNANGNTDPALCDGVPTYQSADGTRVLLRYYDDGTDDIGDSTVWLVADSGTLNTCYGGHYYLDSAHIDGRVGSAPTAPGYSDGNGWFDLNNRRNDGNIRVTAGGGH